MASAPTCVVNMGSATASEATAITLQNQLQSPLLQLPVELRTKIYTFANGGHIIVVKNNGDKNAKCIEPSHVKLFYRLVSGKPSECSAVGTSEASSPFECVSQILTLGRVSRQIRAETSLLEFKQNIFHFRTSVAMETFASMLSIQQRTAVRFISIGTKYVREKMCRILDVEDDETLYEDMPDFDDLFPSLERLYVAPGAMQRLEIYSLELKDEMDQILLGIGGKDQGFEVTVADLLNGLADSEK